MAKTTSIEHALGLQDAAKTMAPGDMCLLFVPRALFEQLSEAARQRGMTLAQLLAVSVDRYLVGPDPTAEQEAAVAPGNAIDENVASFHFTPPGSGPTRPARDPNQPRPAVALKGFR